MIITPDEISQFSELLNASAREFKLFGAESYLRRHPHLLLASGFDEVRITPFDESFIDPEQDPGLDQLLGMGLFKGMTKTDAVLAMRRIYDSTALRTHLICRQIETGVWYETALGRYDRYSFHFNEPLRLIPRAQNCCHRFREPDENLIELDLRTVASNCLKSIRAPIEFGALILPNLWKPPECHPRIELVSATRDILLGLKNGKCDLKNVSWRQLEELVAELLRARGMEVEVTPGSADGGRDIIAHGELIPGEPMVLAIEVKHKDIVSLDDVRSRLYANKDFPAIMFATSGRFTAGVVREKRKAENFLRMFLKDGYGLSQWIDEYI